MHYEGKSQHCVLLVPMSCIVHQQLPVQPGHKPMAESVPWDVSHIAWRLEIISSRRHGLHFQLHSGRHLHLIGEGLQMSLMSAVAYGVMSWSDLVALESELDLGQALNQRMQMQLPASHSSFSAAESCSYHVPVCPFASRQRRRAGRQHLRCQAAVEAPQAEVTAFMDL